MYLTCFYDELLERNIVDLLLIVLNRSSTEELKHAHSPKTLQLHKSEENIFVKAIFIF